MNEWLFYMLFYHVTAVDSLVKQAAVDSILENISEKKFSLFSMSELNYVAIILLFGMFSDRFLCKINIFCKGFTVER